MIWSSFNPQGRRLGMETPMTQFVFRASKQAAIALAFLGTALSTTPIAGQSLRAGNSCRADAPAPPDVQISDCTALLQSGDQAKQPLAGVYLVRGRAYNAKRDFDRALADYDEAIRADAKVATAFSLRGDVWLQKREFDRAIADYEHAIELDPKLAIAFAARGAAWAGKGELGMAIKDFTRATQIDPKLAVAFNDRGFAHAA